MLDPGPGIETIRLLRDLQKATQAILRAIDSVSAADRRRIETLGIKPVFDSHSENDMKLVKYYPGTYGVDYVTGHGTGSQGRGIVACYRPRVQRWKQSKDPENLNVEDVIRILVESSK